MAGSQFRTASDVCTAMTQFTTNTSQSQARGSFSTLDHLTVFSEAITCLCQEVTQLRAELNELKTKQNHSDGAAAKQTAQHAATASDGKASAARKPARKPR